jgi:hypothetical protein
VTQKINVDHSLCVISLPTTGNKEMKSWYHSQTSENGTIVTSQDTLGANVGL